MALVQMLADFVANGGTFADCVAYFGVDKKNDPYAVKAEELYAEKGLIEIDDTTIVSKSEGGCYVAAQVWVADDDLKN